tara:strand:- start:2874 stop:4799 length:1926 start_codon:yes stop_codon:yes gene_type:complete
MRLIFFLVILYGNLFAQSNPVTVTAEMEGEIRAGEVAKISITVSMDEEWYLYSIYKKSEGPLPTEINVFGESVELVGRIIEPEPKKEWDKGFETFSYFHTSGAKFLVPVKINSSLEPGIHNVNLDFYYMVCNDRMCYPPTTKSMTVPITVVAGEAKNTILETSSIISNSDENNSYVSSLLSLFLLAVGGAVLSWVMPCVYPMIPIIISFFGKMSEEKYIGRNTIAFFYGLGIAGTFIIIGLLVGFLSWGVSDVAAQSKYANIGNFIATNSWINLGLGILFIFFALWMFGIINVNVAGKLINKTDQAGQSAKSAYLGSLLLGVTFSITSFSCTVPVVGTLLVVAASGNAGGLITSFYGMSVYGLVFGAPFIALSMFPKALDRLPRSGTWMETLKIIFGFIEIAAAIKFLWVPDLEWELGLLPRNVVLALFIVIGILQIGYLLGLFTIGSAEKIKPFQIGKGRFVGIILTGIVLFPIGMSLASPPTYHYTKMPRLMDEFIEALVPPPPTEDDIARNEGWYVQNYEDALAKAKQEAKPLFIDFTGVYCANCRVMERRVFPTEPVMEQLDKMILTRLYVDKKDSLSATYARLQFERYKQATQPYYVILDPEDEYTLADTGGYIPKGFEDFLLTGVQAFDERRNYK